MTQNSARKQKLVIGGKKKEGKKVKHLIPLITRSMSEKERAGTLKITPTLEAPLATIMTHLKIDATYCNATNTYL
jgi:hypothetical protein